MKPSQVLNLKEIIKIICVERWWLIIKHMTRKLFKIQFVFKYFQKSLKRLDFFNFWKLNFILNWLLWNDPLKLIKWNQLTVSITSRSDSWIQNNFSNIKSILAGEKFKLIFHFVAFQKKVEESQVVAKLITNHAFFNF